MKTVVVMAFLTLLYSTLGCGKQPPQATTCSVVNTDTGAIIKCPDGSTSTIYATRPTKFCSLTPVQGGVEVYCPSDGSTQFVPIALPSPSPVPINVNCEVN